jgi:hypothetical protein
MTRSGIKQKHVRQPKAAEQISCAEHTLPKSEKPFARAMEIN